ncbi:Imm50 family immunity protein [Streptomyces niveiscabiei]|uniref:Imm50 family immunity protein n=1 Tax=Streptomyces niveiscabiei TaxID=164115 RepID=UPI00099E85D3|nr:Imm50 family immunity protein [Streptomyces niveiscabiei]
MTWVALLHNPEGVSSVYGGDVPDLQGVQVHEVALLRDGPTLKIRLDLPEYPERPPRKWALQGFNTVQVEFSFVALREVLVEGFSVEVRADISVREEGGRVKLEVSAEGVRVGAVADTFYLSKISAYADDSSPTL